MKIYRELSAFLVLESDSIRSALSKIEQNKHKIVYVVDEKNGLIGSFADGDFRRWSLQQAELDISVPIGHACNRSCLSMPIGSRTRDIEHSLQRINASIPLIDDYGHVVALVEKGSNFITLDGRRISDEDSTFIIAEIGNNHQGDFDFATRLIDVAVESGAECVKFQMRTMSALYGDRVSSRSPEQDLGAQYILELLERFQLTDDELYRAFDYCSERGIVALCTPWDVLSLEKLERYGLPAYKIASADLTNFDLLHAAAETGKPMICSTGMSSEDEIRQAVDFLERQKAQFIFLHCNSTYPTPFKDVHLNYLGKLKEITRGVVGYSGHERGFTVCLAAVSMGAKVIEKHITTDRSLEGSDHKVSLLPDELAHLVKEVRIVEQSLGSSASRQITQGELVNREILAKSLFATRDISIGETIKESDISVRSPGNGIQPNRIIELIGKKAGRLIKCGEVFFESDIKGSQGKKAKYYFNRPVGIPVRYHDYIRLTENIDLDFVEFHLSYKDLDTDICDFLGEPQDIHLAVHAPELFANDHLLDFASEDPDYREHSIRQFERVIEHVISLKPLFPKTELPVLVVNCGGWNDGGFVNESVRALKYELVERALDSLNLEDVNIAIQTMPPFPWHFGGQSYHNLFVRAEEAADFCHRTGHKLCLDISHSMMACNFYDWDLYDFIETVGKYVIHLHIVDAKGIDGEGVQIGRGDVDFKRLGLLLDKHLPQVPFVPEIWQGHNDNGAGFWQGLEFLERKFRGA